MDILYVVGKGSVFSNAELKYSLRSLEKYGKNVGRIFITGYCPEFIDRSKVVYTHAEDIYAAKHKNIMYKIEQTLKKTDIGEEFLLSSDDHFYINPIDFDQYPHYHKGDIHKEVKDGCGAKGYQISMLNTRALLTAAGLTCKSTNPHCNTHFTRKAWDEIKNLREASMYLDHGAEINCMIGNYLISQEVPFTKFKDIKIKHLKGPGEVRTKVGDGHMFSIYDSAWHEGVFKFLQTEFPNKSKWEVAQK